MFLITLNLFQIYIALFSLVHVAKGIVTDKDEYKDKNISTYGDVYDTNVFESAGKK